MTKGQVRLSIIPVMYTRPHSCPYLQAQTVLSSPACCSTCASQPPAPLAGALAAPCAASHSQPGIINAYKSYEG